MICIICMNQIKKQRVLKCNHTFCTNCINKWICINNKCPTCRAEILNITHKYNLRSRTISQVSIQNLRPPSSLEFDWVDDDFVNSRITRSDSKCHRFSLFISECKVYLKELNIAKQNNASIKEKLILIDKLMKLIYYNIGCIPNRLKGIIFDKINELSNDPNIQVSNKMNYWKMKIIS